MFDIFPFPRTVGHTPEEQIAELLNYLIQFKETLEFAFNNISMENLSPELINKLNELGANIQKSNEERENEVAQISTKSLTISDVCDSQLFKTAIANEIRNNLTFKVNFETGHLEYITQKEEV